MLLFLCVPIAEIYVLIEVGGIVGVGWTIALVVLTAVLGAAMMRMEGMATLQRIQGEMARGGLPAEGLVEGAMLLLAGALLLTPGFITDTVGFIALFRPTRVAMARWFVSRSVVRMSGGQGFRAGVGVPPGGPFGHRPGATPGNGQGHQSARQAGVGQRPGGRTGGRDVIEGEFAREDERQ